MLFAPRANAQACGAAPHRRGAAVAVAPARRTRHGAVAVPRRVWSARPCGRSPRLCCQAGRLAEQGGGRAAGRGMAARDDDNSAGPRGEAVPGGPSGAAGDRGGAAGDHTLDANPPIVFCHMRKAAGTSVVRALENSSCKLARHHRNGQAWSGPHGDAAARILRIWQLDRASWETYVRERVQEDRSTVVLEWNAPPFLLDLCRDPGYEVFTCLRDPYWRFCSEFFFHDAFWVRAGQEARAFNGGKSIDGGARIIASGIVGTRIGGSNNHTTADGRGAADPAESCACSSSPFLEDSSSLVPERRAGELASAWSRRTLFWHRDGGEPFKVSCNRDNYYVRWLCGLFHDPDAELGETHLERAKQMLSAMQGVMILGEPSSYSLLRRYSFSGRLEHVRVNTQRRGDALMDVTREQYEARNALDCRLFAFAKALCTSRVPALPRGCPRDAAQDAIMRNVDFVVTLKERGVLVRAVLEALSRLYAPRRLVVVCASSEVGWITAHLRSGRWVGINTPIEVVDEDSLWLAQPLGLSRQEMEAAFNASVVARNDVDSVDVAAREFGWYLQQCIKLGIGLLMPSLSETYVVWDADLFPLRRWKLCDNEGPGGSARFFTAVLQRAARPGNAYEYVRCLRASTGLEPARPKGGGTFVTHHMVLNRSACRELLGVITQRAQALALCGPVEPRGRWPLAILGLSHSFPRFSEYLTYASFMEHCRSDAASAASTRMDSGNAFPAARRAAKAFLCLPFEAFGMGGLRMREGERFVEQLIAHAGDPDEELDELGAERSASEIDSCGSGDSDRRGGVGSFSDEGDEGSDGGGCGCGHRRRARTTVSTRSVPASAAARHGGFTYDQVLEFAERYFAHDAIPPYLQLEHIYRRSLQPSPPRTWEYHRAYIGGDQLVRMSPREATQARRKLLERRALWWSRFESAGCLFVHVPKNAGTTVEACLRTAVEGRAGEPRYQSQHFTATELRDERFATFERLFKFCVVRNPYERLVSAYRYLRSGGNGTSRADLAWASRLRNLGHFHDFCRFFFSKPVDWANNELPTHFVPQHVFVCAEDGALLVDAYVDMADFAREGLRPLLARGLPGKLVESGCTERVPPPRLRQLPDDKRNEVDCSFSAETANLVFAAYERDFRTFHYERDSWAVAAT